MNLQDMAYIAEIVGAIAVVASLLYVGFQIRDSNRVNQANARHQISEFVLQISVFNAQHADRLAAIQEKTELSESDRLFRWWSHMMVVLHAETYYHHHDLGLMPDGHWQGYSRYVEGYVVSPGMADFWAEVGPGFSRDFSTWMTEIVNRRNGTSLAGHQGGGVVVDAPGSGVG